MNFKKYFFMCLILKVLCEKLLDKNSEILSISKALRDVAEEFYIKNQIQFDVIAISDDSRRFDQLIYHLLDQNETENTNRISSFSKDLNEVFGIGFAAIILSVTINDYLFINTKFCFANMFTKNFKFLIYIEDCGLDLLENDISQFTRRQQLTFRHGLIEHYEFLLINDGDFLYLATIEWFTDVACNQPQLKVLNSFNKITQKWTKKLENYEKFRDFHGCDLNLWISYESGLSKFGSININVEPKAGLIPQVFIDVSQKYNYKPKFQAQEEGAEVCFDIFRLSSVIEMGLHFTASFMEIRDIILATPGDLYSPYEKLWLPFDDLTWKLLLSTFLVAFLAIFLINLLPKSVRGIVYGINVHKPALNVISAFFGIPQYKVPKKYFSRCLFIIFVFFCLIFRTCYQSKLFEFMTSEPRRPPPKSIQDLRNRNYTMYTYLDSVEGKIADDKYNWPLIKNTTYIELYYIIVGQSQNSSAKISLITQERSLNVIQHKFARSLKWHQLKNINFHVSQIGFFFFPNHFFLNIIDKETQRLTSAGIMNYLLNLIFKDKCSFAYSKEWKVLTMEKLSFGFIIWLYSCAVTVLFFVLELMFCFAIARAKISLKGYIRYKWNKFPLNYPIKIRMNQKHLVHK